MGLLSSSSKSDQKVTNNNTSASGAVQAGAGSSTSLSGLNLMAGASGKNAQAGTIALTLTDQGAIANAYDVADRSFSSIESALAGVSEFANSSLSKLADAFKTTQTQSLQAFQAANDFTSDSIGRASPTVDSQKLITYAIVGGLVLGGLFILNRRKG